MPKRTTCAILVVILLVGSSSFCQEQPAMDAEALKILAGYQKQNESVPPEILTLMPANLQITDKQWMVEASRKMLLQLRLHSYLGSTQIENSESYALDLLIIMTAYNPNSMVGKMTADQSLDMQRQEAKENWQRIHQAEKVDYLEQFKPVMTPVPGGAIYIQKIYSAAHHEGEGTVPARTEYCGFLYMDMPVGWLTAEIQNVPNTQMEIDKWHKHMAATAAQIKPDKYFN